MDPSVAVLTHAGMGYRPLAQGIPHHRRLPTQGLPFTGGPYGGLAAMGLTGPMQRMMGEVGMTPMGVGHDQNVYDRLMNQRFTLMQMQAMQMAAQMDRDAYAQTFRGLAAVSGTPFGGEQRRAAQALANSATTMAPLFAEMMPEFLDQLGGTRGSATVLAKRLIDAGRYRVDPVTGRMGMSAASAGALATNLYGDLFSDQNLPQMRGVTAGQVGSLVQELQSRGMLRTAAAEGRFMGVRGDDPRAATLRALDEMRRSAPDALSAAARATGVDMSRPGGITAEDLDKLNLDPRVADRLRSFDAGRIKRSVKQYVDVVAAMRDIFGDMGKPNAPMAELVAGVEALTMGGMSQIDPGRMSMMVRNTYQLAKQTGVTMEGVMLMQQHAANRAGQMGVEPAFAVQATQGALAFGGAYRAQGHAAFTAWGAMSADQVTQLDTNLRVQAAASNAANRMAVATRLAEQGGGFDPNSDAGRFVAAVRGGLDQYRGADGTLRSVMMNDRDFTRMLTGAGRNISEGDVQTMLGQRDTNREYVERYGMADTVRRIQGTDELHPFVGHRLQETLASRFRDNLVRGGMAAGDAMTRARTAAAGISRQVTNRMFGLSTEEFADTQGRNRAVAGFIREELDAGGFEDVLGGLDAGQQDAFLTQSADRFYGAANRAIRGSMYRAFGNLQNVHRLTNRTTLDESDRQRMGARFTAEMEEALSPLGRGSMLQRAVDALRNARPDDPRGALGIVASTLGGVRIEDVNRALMPKFQAVNERRRAVEDLQQQIAREHDPETRARLMERLDVVRRELSNQASALARTGEQFGLFAGDSLSHDDLTRAMDSTRGLMTAQNDIVGLRGNFGSEVTQAQIDSLRGNPGAITPADQMAVVLSRRQADVESIRNHLTRGTAITPDQAGNLARFAGQVRGMPGGGGMNDHAANLAALDVMAANVGNISPADLAAVTADTLRGDAGAAAAVIRGRRQQIPYRASDEAVAAIRRQFPQLTAEEAADIANNRMRAARLGVDQATVESFRNRPENHGKYQGPYGEVEAVADIFASRAAGMFDVSDGEISALTGSPGYQAPNSDAIRRFREDNRLTGSDAEITREMQRRFVFGTKRAAARDRFGSFWGSTEGAAFREQTDMATQDVENVAARLVGSPQTVQRLGTRAIELAEGLRGGQQRLRELAMFHTGGDLARLMARDFSGVKAATPEEARTVIDRLNAEVTQIQYQQRAAMAELAGQDGLPGRRFQLGDEAATRRQVLDEHVRAGNMTREQADRLAGQGLGPARMMQVEAMRREIGGERAVRDLLRLGHGALSDADQAKVNAARFGAGTDEAARQLLGPLQVQQPEETNQAFAARQAEYDRHVRDVRRGMASTEVARERLGIPADEVPADVLRQIDQRRELVGNEDEAYRLMGRRRGDPMGTWDRMRHAQLAYDVGIARRIKPGDEAALTGFEARSERMRRMAASRGLSVDAIETEGDRLLLTPDQRNRLDAARRASSASETAAGQLGSRAASLRSRLNALGDGIDNEGKNQQRAALQEELRRVEGQIAAHNTARDRAVAGLSDDAAARGVSPADYVRGRGWIDARGLELFRGEQAERNADRAKIEEIARGMGVSPDDLAGATGVTRRLQAAQRGAASRESANPVELTRTILREYGFRVGDQPGDFERSFSRLLEGSAGRGMGERVLSSQRELVAAAGRRSGGPGGIAGVDAMASEYFKAVRSGKAGDMEAFRRTYGLYETDAHGQLTGSANADFERFQRAIQFQQQTGLLSFGGERSAFRTKNTEQDLARLFSGAVGAQMRPEAGGQPQAPARLEMSGTVTLRGDQLDFSGAWGGGRAYGVPGGN